MGRNEIRTKAGEGGMVSEVEETRLKKVLERGEGKWATVWVLTGCRCVRLACA